MQQQTKMAFRTAAASSSSCLKRWMHFLQDNYKRIGFWKNKLAESETPPGPKNVILVFAIDDCK